MVLKKEGRYILRFVIKGYELVYQATIIADDGQIIEFVDKHNKKWAYNRSKLLTAEEII